MKKITMWLSALLMLPLMGQDLWKDGVEKLPGVANFAVGSVIEVQFANDFHFFYSTELDRTKINSVGDFPILADLVGEFLGPSAGATTGSRNTTIRSRSRSRGGMGAIITAFNPLTSTYTLQGTRQIVWNGVDQETIAFTAEINQTDINEDRTISATKLGNFNVLYENGSNAITLTAADFEQLSFPTIAEITAAEATRTELEVALRERSQTPPSEQVVAAPETVTDSSIIVPSPPDPLEGSTVPDVDPLGDTTATVLPEVPKNTIELSAAAKRRILLQLINIILKDGF